MPNSKICAGALLVVLNLHCTGVPSEPKKAEAVATAETTPTLIRWIAAAYEAHASARLVDAQQLRVDLEAPADTGQTLGWLFPGQVSVDAYDDLVTLRAAPADAATPTKMVLHGGVDAPRPLVYEDVAPGAYTVCAQVGPARDHSVDWASLPVRCAHVTVTDEPESRAIVLRG
ncbi:hypothetical protein [Nannocystis radixulma]|uniref:Uncharacterized protein n=1 Tax=Nannocystis radixulma TaxID=2995305 RepID=A0ABT5B8J9_9BACT|nr:hypothetical protein [Nannocystis radixulma]MDC0670453.1 hypothetical protein [Nannocystis radixulma]